MMLGGRFLARLEILGRLILKVATQLAHEKSQLGPTLFIRVCMYIFIISSFSHFYKDLFLSLLHFSLVYKGLYVHLYNFFISHTFIKVCMYIYKISSFFILL